jgi:excinuclease UvrABC nuclease subunit
MIRLFLQNSQEELAEKLTGKIEAHSEGLEFEQAGYWRDVLVELKSLWKSKHKRYWPDNITDTWSRSENKDITLLHLSSRRHKKILDERVFRIERKSGINESAAIYEILLEFYSFYVPKEIRLSFNIDHLENFKHQLAQKFETIRVILDISPDINNESMLQPVQPNSSEDNSLFELRNNPRIIYAFGVLSTGDTTIVSKIFWKNGKRIPRNDEVWSIDGMSGSEAFVAAVNLGIKKAADRPDLILLRGAAGQLTSFLDELESGRLQDTTIAFVSKTRNSIKQCAHIVNNSEVRKISLDNPIIIERLLESASKLAIRLHRLLKEASEFYELASILPYIPESQRRQILRKAGSIRYLKNLSIGEMEALYGRDTALEIDYLIRQNSDTSIKKLPPIRFHAPEGEADDLQPITTINLPKGK